MLFDGSSGCSSSPVLRKRRRRWPLAWLRAVAIAGFHQAGGVAPSQLHTVVVLRAGRDLRWCRERSVDPCYRQGHWSLALDRPERTEAKYATRSELRPGPKPGRPRIRSWDYRPSLAPKGADDMAARPKPAKLATQQRLHDEGTNPTQPEAESGAGWRPTCSGSSPMIQRCGCHPRPSTSRSTSRAGVPCAESWPPACVPAGLYANPDVKAPSGGVGSPAWSASANAQPRLRTEQYRATGRGPHPRQERPLCDRHPARALKPLPDPAPPGPGSQRRRRQKP